jgi:TusA-related sulfurtransferase
MRIPLFVAVAALALLAGCDSCKNNASTTGADAAPAGSASATASASASASAGPLASVAPAGNQAHCPVAVAGAKTDLANVDGGVELTITGPDDATASAIRARVQALIDASKNQSPMKHTGSGGGAGIFGRCPIVLKNTTVAAADVPGGSKVTVTTKVADEVDWLRRETSDRLREMSAPGSEGAGERKMANCPSSVEGAKTVVANTKDGVTVTVTGTTDQATSDIRARAKHVAEVSTHDGGPVAHTGGGEGGGTLGRCPVVLGNTIVTEKDVPGGAELTVKARNATEVASVQAEAKERAAKFGLK